MSNLPELIIHGSTTRAVDDVVTIEWRLVTRGTKSSPASISLTLEGAILRSGRVVYGTENGQTANTELHEQFLAEPGDLIQAFFQVVPDGSVDRVNATAVLHTPTGEHPSPNASITVEREQDVFVTWHTFDDGNKQIVEATLTAKTDIAKSTLTIDAPEQVVIEPIVMNCESLTRGSVATYRAGIEIDDDAPVTISNARITVGSTDFSLPSLTIEPNHRSDLELSIGGDTLHPLGEMAEAWILVKNNGRRPRAAILQVTSDDLTIARTPEARIVAPGTTQRWSVSYAGKRQGTASLTATLGSISQTHSVTIQRSTMQSAVRGAGSFDNVSNSRYELYFSVRDFASGSRLSVLTVPGMYPRSVIGVGGSRVETPMHEDGQRYQSNVISDGDDLVTVVFGPTPVDAEKNHPASIVLFERDSSGVEFQVGSHSIIVRARAIVKNLRVSKAQAAVNPHEETKISVSASNAGAATANLPFSLQAENFVEFSWDSGIPITDIVTVMGQSSFERQLIARLGEVPAGRTSTTIGMRIGKQTFTRVLSIRDPARVERAYVEATDDGFAIGFANGGAVSADQAIVIIRGAEVSSAIAKDFQERVLSVSESRVFYGPVHVGESARILVRVKRYFEAVNLAVVIGDSRCDLSFVPPSANIMSFGGMEFEEADMSKPIYSVAPSSPVIAGTPTSTLNVDNSAPNSYDQHEQHEQHEQHDEMSFPSLLDLQAQALASVQSETGDEISHGHSNDEAEYTRHGETPQFDEVETHSDDLHGDELHHDDLHDDELPPVLPSLPKSGEAEDISSRLNDNSNQQFGADQTVHVTNLLMDTDLKIIERLRSIKNQSRVIHAYVASLFVDPLCDDGALIRKNIVKSLACDAIGRDHATSWTLFPPESVAWLGQSSEAEAIAFLAEQIGATDDLAPQLKEYLEGVATSYRSLEGLEDAPLRERLFSPATQLDILLNNVIPTESHA